MAGHSGAGGAQASKPDDVRAPLAWCVAGIPGSGKSLFGSALARDVRGALLDQDSLTNPLMRELAARIGAGDDFDDPRLATDVRTARYRCLADAAADNLRTGLDAVIVAPFTREISSEARWLEWAELLEPAAVRLVWVGVTPEVAAARRQIRDHPRDRAARRAGLLLRQPPTIEIEHLRVDGTADPAAEARRIARHRR